MLNFSVSLWTYYFWGCYRWNIFMGQILHRIISGSTSSGGVPLPGSAPGAHVTTTLPPPALPVSLFMAFCPEQPNGPRPNTPLPIPTPCQRVGIVTRDAGTGVQRTLSPTAYRPEQTGGITSLWAPQGLGMIRDGNSQFRRIYWEWKVRDIGYWELREARLLLLGETQDAHSFLNFLQPVR